jgi:hypothetical protein
MWLESPSDMGDQIIRSAMARQCPQVAQNGHAQGAV